MIKISIYQDEEDVITGIKLIGHAGFAEYGQDIVCAAVSALVFNAINSVEKFTSDVFSLEQDEKKGLIEFHVTSPISEESKLLLNSLVLGLSGIQEDYGLKFMKFASA